MARLAFKILKFVEISGAIAVLALVSLLFVNIIAREVFSISLVWANEMCLILFSWAVFLGAGVAFGHGARIRFTFLADKLATSSQKILNVFITWFGFSLLLVMLYIGSQVVTLNWNQRLTSVDATAAWQWASLPVGILVALVGWAAQGPWKIKVETGEK